jgi:hypothetical protein
MSDMRRFLPTSLAALAGVAVLNGAASATLIRPSAPPPLYARVAKAEYVVVARVTGLGRPVTVPFDAYNPQLKTQMSVAKVKVSQVLLGPRKITQALVGFRAPGRGILGGQQDDLPVGTEGVLFLNVHHTGRFYALSDYPAVLKKDSSDYKDEVAYIERCAKLLKSPDAGLKSENKEDRLLTAALIIVRYRTYHGKSLRPKMVPIPAARSKLILEQLAAADWTPKADSKGPNPMFLLDYLQLTAKDGWKFPLTFGVPSKDYLRKRALAGQEWVKKHVKTYRIRRYVEKGKKKGGRR